METILVTGGAGFIGSHLADELVDRGHRVRVLDTLTAQVHGGVERPEYLSDDVELVVGDVRDRSLVREALEGVDAVVHFAARVGVGQSMYELAEYVGANSHGTAILLEALLDRAGGCGAVGVGARGVGGRDPAGPRAPPGGAPRPPGAQAARCRELVDLRGGRVRAGAGARGDDRRSRSSPLGAARRGRGGAD